MSNSLRPYGVQSARLLCPWDFPGKNTGVGCHYLLQGIFPTEGSNPCLLCLLHWQVGSLPVELSPGRYVSTCLSQSFFLGKIIKILICRPAELALTFTCGQQLPNNILRSWNVRAMTGRGETGEEKMCIG